MNVETQVIKQSKRMTIYHLFLLKYSVLLVKLVGSQSLKSVHSLGFTRYMASLGVGREFSRNDITRFLKDGLALHDRSTGVVERYVLRNQTVSVGCHTVTGRQSIIGSLQLSFWTSPLNRGGTLGSLAPSAKRMTTSPPQLTMITP